MKIKFYNSNQIRYKTRCSTCGALVRGKPTQFALSCELGKVEFLCPACDINSIVEIKSLIREEITYNID